MKITVKPGVPLSAVIGQNEIVLSMTDGATVDDLLKELRVRYPDFDEGVRGKGLPVMQDHPFYRLVVNSGLVPWEDVAAIPLHDGDRVFFFLPYDGG